VNELDPRQFENPRPRNLRGISASMGQWNRKEIHNSKLHKESKRGSIAKHCNAGKYWFDQ
jgi:hypothetical protein